MDDGMVVMDGWMDGWMMTDGQQQIGVGWRGCGAIWVGLKSYIKRNSGGRWFPQQPSCLFSLSSSLRLSFLFLLT